MNCLFRWSHFEEIDNQIYKSDSLSLIRFPIGNQMLNFQLHLLDLTNSRVQMNSLLILYFQIVRLYNQKYYFVLRWLMIHPLLRQMLYCVMRSEERRVG